MLTNTEILISHKFRKTFQPNVKKQKLKIRPHKPDPSTLLIHPIFPISIFSNPTEQSINPYNITILHKEFTFNIENNRSRFQILSYKIKQNIFYRLT